MPQYGESADRYDRFMNNFNDLSVFENGCGNGDVGKLEIKSTSSIEGGSYTNY